MTCDATCSGVFARLAPRAKREARASRLEGIDGVNPDEALTRTCVLLPGAPLPKTSPGRWRMADVLQLTVGPAQLYELGVLLVVRPSCRSPVSMSA